MKHLLRFTSLLLAVVLLAALILPASADGAGQSWETTVLFTHDLHSHFFPQADGTQPEFRTYETVEIEGTTYYLAQGRYRNWSDFEAAVDGLFTDAFWTARNEGEGGPIYTQLDGRLCLRDLSKGADLSRNDFFPDTFRLLEAGEEEISFLLIGYYSDETAPLEGESPAERDARLAAGYDETREYPICMVHTAQGWRFERFYTTWSDEPPEAA